VSNNGAHYGEIDTLRMVQVQDKMTPHQTVTDSNLKNTSGNILK